MLKRRIIKKSYDVLWRMTLDVLLKNSMSRQLMIKKMSPTKKVRFLMNSVCKFFQDFSEVRETLSKHESFILKIVCYLYIWICTFWIKLLSIFFFFIYEQWHVHTSECIGIVSDRFGHFIGLRACIICIKNSLDTIFRLQK